MQTSECIESSSYVIGVCVPMEKVATNLTN